MPDSIIGVDVSKAWIDVCSGSKKVKRIAMEAEALAVFAGEARSQQAFVVFEATGAYDEPLREALEAEGVAYARVNPAQARAFAQSRGILGKTDRVDARVLTEMGARLDLVPTVPLPSARRALKIAAARRRQLVETRKQELNRLSLARTPGLLDSIHRHLAWLATEIKALEAEIATLTSKVPELAAQAALMRSAPGVGPVVASALLAQCPELGSLGRRQIAKLAGLAPLARDSGQRQGARAIGGGRPDLRARLYNAAFSACRCEPEFKALRKRLESEGKPFKVILIIAAHKLLRRLNAMVKANQFYQPQRLA